MSEPKTLSTISRLDVDRLTKQRGEPGWLEKLRFAAFEAYFEAEAPSTRSDDWRKTLVETLDLQTVVPLGIEQPGESNARITLKTDLEEQLKKLSGIIAQLSGVTVEQKLDEALAKKGVIFCSMDEAVRKHSDVLKTYLEKTSLDKSIGKLSLMATAFFSGGAFLYVPKGVEIEAPFAVINAIASATTTGEALFPRLLVIAEENSSVRIVNVFTGGTSTPQNGSAQKPKERAKRPWILAGTLADVFVKQNANVSYLELFNLGRQVFLTARNSNHVERDASLTSMSAALGGGQIKSDIITNLLDRGSSADVRGVVLGDGEEHFAFNTVQNHDASDTTSNINFRVALKENAVSSYQGTIKVSLTASRTDAFQSNKNLLLSENAKAESIPRLEILTDDVKCSHGATVGPVDKNQVFYLMSRGLDQKEAEEFIVTGFFNTILSQLKIEGASEWIENLIGDKIHFEGIKS